MKRNNLVTLSRILFLIFIFWTLLTLLIVGRDLAGKLAYYTVIAYVVYAFLILVYVLGFSTYSFLKLSKDKQKERLKLFLGSIVLIFILEVVLTLVIRKTQMDYMKSFAYSLVLSFAFSFGDLLLVKEKN